MSSEQKFALTSAQARQAYTKWYLSESAHDAPRSLEPIVIDDFFPYPEYKGHIPRDKQETDLEFKVKLWPNYAIDATETDVVSIYVRRKGTESWGNPTSTPQRFIGPIDSMSFPSPFTLNASFFASEGEYELKYSVRISTGDVDDSEIYTFVVDKTPPNDNQIPTNRLDFKDEEAKNEGLTKVYLDKVISTGVPMIVPGYSGERLQDGIEVYVKFEGDPIAHQVFNDVIPADRTVLIPVAIFTGKEDGLLIFTYKLKDIVGNVGPFSVQFVTDLLLKPLPVGPFNPLRVPLAEDVKKLIDLGDVRAGVKAVVPRYTNHGKNDRIYITWGSYTASTPHIVGENPPLNIIIDVSDTELIIPDYGVSTGEKPTDVTYRIERGTHTFDADSVLPINVDLSQVIDPSILPPVLVRGGGAAPEDNKLVVGDIGLNATATFTVPLGLTGVDWARLYWGDLPDHVAEVTPVPAPGSDLTFDVPWTEIEKVPGTVIQVYYEVGKTGDNNPSRSTVTPVDVQAAVPIRLEEPEFLDARLVDGNLWINCSSWQGPEANLRLQIPANPRLTPGQAMEIKVQGYSDFPPVTAVGTTWIKSIPELSESQVEDGFVEMVGPRADYFSDLLSRRGALKVDYTVDVGGTPLSGTLTIRAASTNAGGLCPINP